MPIRRKNVVEYFPHYVNSSAKKHAIEGKYKATGYVFWFKLLEVLCASGTFSISWDNIAQRDWLISETFTDEITALDILDYLAKIKAIDQELWESHIVWVQKLINNLLPVFLHRTDKTIPSKPIPLNNPLINRIEYSRIEGCNQSDSKMSSGCQQDGSNKITSCKQAVSRKKSKGDVIVLES